MRRLTLALIMLYMASAQAQNSGDVAKNPWTLEVGLNSTLLTKQILNLSLNNIPFSVFDYTIRVTEPSTKFAYRLGLGGNYTKSSSINQSSGGAGSFENENRSENIFMRNGLEYIHTQNKLSMHVGFDVVTNKSSNFNRSNDFKAEDKAISRGFGPVLGLRYQFGKHFSVYTEGSYYRLSNKITNSTEQVGFRNSTEGKSTTASVLAPTTIYFQYKFNLNKIK